MFQSVWDRQETRAQLSVWVPGKLLGRKSKLMSPWNTHPESESWRNKKKNLAKSVFVCNFGFFLGGGYLRLFLVYVKENYCKSKTRKLPFNSFCNFKIIFEMGLFQPISKINTFKKFLTWSNICDYPILKIQKAMRNYYYAVF